MKLSFQTSPDQSGLSLPESFISVTVLNHLRPTLKPALRLNPHVDHCPLYTVYWDHCLYDVWTTVQQLLWEIYRTTMTQALLVFCCPLHLTLSIYRVRTAFNTWPKVPTVCWVSLLLHSRVRATDRHCRQMRRKNIFGTKKYDLAKTSGEKKIIPIKKSPPKYHPSITAVHWIPVKQF